MAVIGIDLGTQSLKAVVVDEPLIVRGSHRTTYQPAYPRPGWAEQDSTVWLDALRPTISAALAASSLTAADIDAISVTGQLDGCLPVGNDGRALAPALIWMDRRAVNEISGIDPDWIRERTGTVLDPTHMAAKIRWFSKHLAQANQVAHWHQPVSYIVSRLCGHHVMDHSLASTTMLYDVHRTCWSDELLAVFEIDRRQLPDIADAMAIAGELTPYGADLSGLLPGTRVIVGTGDDFSGAVGAGIVAPGRISSSIGTAEVVGAISDTAIHDEDDLVETHGFPGGRYFLENPGWLGGGAVTWFCSTFGISSAAEMAALAGSGAPGADNLLFLPALAGAMAPRWIPSARGAFYGLTAGHGRSECARAVMEGCAFAMRDVSSRLAEMLGPSAAIRLSGGGSQSDIWASIRADVSGLPIEVVTNPDTAPLGAAVFALMSASKTPSIEELAARINPVAKVVEPNPETTSRYNDCYARYRKLFDSLSPMFEEE